MIRILIIAGAIAAAILLPWWCTVLMLLISSLLFNHFHESIAVAFIMDVLYGPIPDMDLMRFPFTLFFIFISLTLPIVKRRLIYYRG